MPNQPRLIVVLAFRRSEEGDLVAASDPVQFDSEDRARRHARSIAPDHAGVVAWSRSADPDNGDYGEPVELYRAGEVPDLD